jgi:predicted Fe-Mo cluster-binding NifX family protein
MKVAIPMFNQDVAPRFGFADRFIIAEIVGKEIVECRSFPLKGDGVLERLEEISGRGADTLLCGGFNRNYLPLAKNMGMTVYLGLIGSGEEILSSFLRGKLIARNNFGRR